MNHIRMQLLNELLGSRQKFVSGEELSERLHVSRTAIWKHIEELRKEGYEIKAVRKQGYQLLSVPNALTDSTILPYLETESFGRELYVYDRVVSTQQICHRLAREGAPSGTVVVANQQSAGKGRLGRKWFSPPGTGIWMSLIIRPDIPLSSAPQLTLLSSVAMCRAIRKHVNLPVHIKWPNDVQVNGKKVAGILTELNAETDRINYLVIGVGMNINQEEGSFPEELKEIATSLRIESGSPISRSKLIIDILHCWEELYYIYVDKGFGPIKSLWESYTNSIGTLVKARTLQSEIEGIAQSITDEGVLLIKDARGNIHKIYSADIETI